MLLLETERSGQTNLLRGLQDLARAGGEQPESSRVGGHHGAWFDRLALQGMRHENKGVGGSNPLAPTKYFPEAEASDKPSEASAFPKSGAATSQQPLNA